MKSLTAKIKEYACSLGFDACGCSRAEPVDSAIAKCFKEWIGNSLHAGMGYMANYEDKRLSPGLLADDAKSVISVALNYYPKEKQAPGNPQIAYYAYGKDYHIVMKEKLNALLDFIKSLDSGASGRAFCDTAPILERYWAAQCGIGFVGKNSMLIIPRKGSFFFLGELIINRELEYDKPLGLSCGTCTRCVDACPTKAIARPYCIDSDRCISYQTIENRNEINPDVAAKLGNCFYGCDICQNVCPWNRFSEPHNTPEFCPSPKLLNLTYDVAENLSEEEYRSIFKGSAVKRAKYAGLKRNIAALLHKE